MVHKKVWKRACWIEWRESLQKLSVSCFIYLFTLLRAKELEEGILGCAEGPAGGEEAAIGDVKRD